MSRIELAPEIAQDFERILNHLAEYEVQDTAFRIGDIIAVLDVLERSPLIGRSTAGENRELVIGKGARGHVALYRYAAAIDTVLILAIRSQREAGWSRGR